MKMLKEVAKEALKNAIQKERFSLVEFWVNHGAVVDKETIDLAKKTGNRKIILFLARARAKQMQ